MRRDAVGVGVWALATAGPPEPQPQLYLAGGGGGRAGQHRCVGDLHVQVIIVDERPGALHLAGLEAVCESPEVRVPEEAAVRVVGGRRVLVEALLVVADLGAVGALLAVARRWQGAQARLRRGAILGAIVLAHEVLYAMDGRVVGQVAPAGTGRAPRAQGIGAQRRAELGGVVRGWGVAARRGAPELRVALEDLARGRGCGAQEGTGGQDQRAGSALLTRGDQQRRHTRRTSPPRRATRAARSRPDGK